MSSDIRNLFRRCSRTIPPLSDGRADFMLPLARTPSLKGPAMSRLSLLTLLLLPALAPALELHLPLGRKAYQTNESIELAVVLTGSALSADEMTVTASAEQGGKLA